MLNACLCLISTVHTGSQDAQKTSPYLEWRAPCSIKCALVSDIGVLIEDCCCEREQGSQISVVCGLLEEVWLQCTHHRVLHPD